MRRAVFFLIWFCSQIGWAERESSLFHQDELCPEKVIKYSFQDFYAVRLLLRMHPSMDCEFVRSLKWRESKDYIFTSDAINLGMHRKIHVRVMPDGSLGVLLLTFPGDFTMYDGIMETLGEGLTQPQSRFQMSAWRVAYEWSPMREKRAGGFQDFFRRLQQLVQ